MQQDKQTLLKEGYIMAAGQGGRQHVVPGIHKLMDNFKYEVAAELGLPVKQSSEDYWGNLTSRDCGAVGGQMVRKMIQIAQQQIAQNQTLQQ
jgi:small acid-soluble spore protein A (major alpha-type SASP)